MNHQLEYLNFGALRKLDLYGSHNVTARDIVFAANPQNLEKHKVKATPGQWLWTDSSTDMEPTSVPSGITVRHFLGQLEPNTVFIHRCARVFAVFPTWSLCDHTQTPHILHTLPLKVAQLNSQTICGQSTQSGTALCRIIGFATGWFEKHCLSIPKIGLKSHLVAPYGTWMCTYAHE